MASEFEQVRQAEPKSRIQRRQARVIARAERAQKQPSREKDTEQKKPTKKRLIPIWLRMLIVVVLLVVSMTAGVMFGYGVIGNGKAMDALKFSTWEHLVDLVVKGTDESK